MARGRKLLVLIALLWPAVPARGQYQPPAQSLAIQAPHADTWTQGATQIVLLDGGVTLEIDDAKLSARTAVVWITPVPGVALDTQRVEVALIDDARLIQGAVRREGPVLYVTATLAGAVRLIADDRRGRDSGGSATYQKALTVREAGKTGQTLPGAPANAAPAANAVATSQPSPVRRSGAGEPVQFRFPGTLRTLRDDDGKIAVEIEGGVTLYQRGKEGDFLELRADRVVLFTSLDKLGDAMGGGDRPTLEKTIRGAYLEGDVRIVYTPAGSKIGESRLTAERAYYDFTTDRAILTDAILHAIDPGRQIPIILRAKTIRQLALSDARREYGAEDLVLTTSAFATPSYAVAAEKAYVRQTQLPGESPITRFGADNATLETFGVPVFWLPGIGGTVTQNGIPLRALQLENSSRFGMGARSQWGLFETLGRPAPPGLDMAYRLDYLGDRGPATGLDARYTGGFITETTRDPWNFAGDFTSYVILDRGKDDLPADRADVTPPGDLRGRFLWKHQHFFPDDWQVQMRAGYVSDPTFLEEYFENDYYRNRPHDLSLYVKRQRDTEALTFALDYQPNDFVTNVDYVQEQFEIDRIPEIGYHRIGDAPAGDAMTFYSDNTLSALRFSPTSATLAEQGFVGPLNPGLPSVGWTGTTGDYVARGDFRQEVAFPFSAGQIRMAPYVVGRYTGYSDSPYGVAENRLYAGAGMRFGTAFWAVDDTVESRLLDLHRLRHVVEPQLQLFAGAQSVDRDKLYLYDEGVDAINDVSGASMALRQRWQTQRGGPGRWRSVDVFTLNLEANYFVNQPPDAQLRPYAFRGLFFPSVPEASVPRQSLNADATWRISDTTALLSDVQYNWEAEELATASIGLAVSRDPRMTYFIGQRYIEELHSNILSASISYDLSTKYTLILGQSFDFGRQTQVSTSGTVVRRFDTFMAAIRVYYDATNDESGVSFNLLPLGLGYGLGTDALTPSDQ